ncbi:PDZ domain-containing protein [Deinococcus navajonensis]|uniref:PDZ domain-containing protein n=1 Tax=Deinococcus navajonensis TaxID=309884 RepID=A0ABV8XK20_9DEIO
MGPPPARDAFTVYDVAAGHLRDHYAGVNMGLLENWLTEGRAMLSGHCEGHAPCPVALGQEAVETVVNLLGDPHTGVGWSMTVAGLRQARTEPRVWSGLLTVMSAGGALQVIHVDPQSPAARAGFLPGDVVLSVNGQGDPDRLQGRLRQAEEAAKALPWSAGARGQHRP